MWNSSNFAFQRRNYDIDCYNKNIEWYGTVSMKISLKYQHLHFLFQISPIFIWFSLKLARSYLSSLINLSLSFSSPFQSTRVQKMHSKNIPFPLFWLAHSSKPAFHWTVLQSLNISFSFVFHCLSYSISFVVHSKQNEIHRCRSFLLARTLPCSSCSWRKKIRLYDCW